MREEKEDKFIDLLQNNIGHNSKESRLIDRTGAYSLFSFYNDPLGMIDLIKGE